MITKLKNNFTHAALGTIIWIVLLTSLTSLNAPVPFHFFWNIIGIGILAGLLLGVMYPLLWNYCTFSAPVNIVISSLANVMLQFIAVSLYSKDMFALIAPYFPGIAILTVLGHIAGFYFYRNSQNQKLAQELNQLQQNQ